MRKEILIGDDMSYYRPTTFYEYLTTIIQVYWLVIKRRLCK